MVLVRVGFSNPRGGVKMKAGRQQFLREKPPKTLAQRLHKPKKHADTDEAFRQTRVHPQPAGDRSFAKAPLTVAQHARSCATVILNSSWRSLLTPQISLTSPPRVQKCGAQDSTRLGPQCGPGLQFLALPRVRRTRREERAQFPQTILLRSKVSKIWPLSRRPACSATGSLLVVSISGQTHNESHC